MKIQSISTHKPYINYGKNIDLYDYTNENTEISLKDAIVYSAVTSGIIAIGIALFGHFDSLSKFIKTKSNSINKIV